MAKKSARQSFFQKHPRLPYIAVAGLVVLVLGLGVFCKVLWWYSRNLDERSNVNTLSTLITRAANGLKVEAPIDAKTGDIYFPQAKLYVPAPNSPTRLSYEYNPYGPDGP